MSVPVEELLAINWLASYRRLLTQLWSLEFAPGCGHAGADRCCGIPGGRAAGRD